jgi:hypothetical protein
MATGYGIKSTLVTSANIHAVNLYNCTTITAETGNIGPNGGYQVKVSHNTGGCGSEQDNGIFLELNDTVPWTRITWEWLGTGTGACWSFNHSSGFGGGAGPTTGYLQNYDANLDVISRSFLSWEVAEYQSHSRVYACDNDANNFFRFNGGEFKSFFMNRRRDTSGNKAGIHHGRSCNTTGVFSIIRNIRIY